MTGTTDDKPLRQVGICSCCGVPEYLTDKGIIGKHKEECPKTQGDPLEWTQEGDFFFEYREGK